MSEYTEEDFADAVFARHRQGWVAMRPKSDGLWHASTGERMGDCVMALDGWVPVSAATTVSLDTLREAWENAEEPTDDYPIRAGDVCIESIREGAYAVREAPQCGFSGRAFRVLTRATAPEPWQALGDALSAVGANVQEWVIRELHERGVRVTGGDDQ